jgi:hypothetical protein
VSERTPGGGDEAMDLGTISRDDVLLDALGRGAGVPDADELAALLAAWRADLTDDPATDVSPGAPAVRRARPWTLRLAAAAVALLALVSGLGVGSHRAGPDSPLWSLTRLLYPQQAEVRAVEDSITRARAALDVGRLDDAGRLIDQARRDLAAIDDPATVDRLRFIRGAQRLGLRLREIADLLAVRDRGACPCGHAEALVRQRISELDAEIARLVDIRHELTRLAANCAAGACPDGVWPCEAEFVQAGKEVSTT